MDLGGIRYGAEIVAAAARHHIDPRLLAAIAAQETGGPGSNSGNNVIGDGGHGRGLFQIDDRSWAFARSSAAMDPAQNADMAATILQDNLQRYGGNERMAVSAYNSGSPTAPGTPTTWKDGTTLSYADSVFRHYRQLGDAAQGQLLADNRDTASNVNALAALGAARPPAPVAASLPGFAGASLPAPLPPPASDGPPAVQVAPFSATAPPQSSGSASTAANDAQAQADLLVASLVVPGDVFGDPADDAA